MDFSSKDGALYQKSKAWRSSLYFFALLALIILSVGTILHFYDRHNAVNNWASGEQVGLNTVTSHLTGRFRDFLYEPIILASHSELYGNDAASHLELSDAFIRVANVLPFFYQLRFIDVSGMEKVRVNTENGLPSAVPEHELQNKSDRYYFIEGMKLEPGEVYVSPMDLNVEAGDIEHPLRPVIRFVLPAIDSEGGKQGIIVANFSADSLLREVATYDRDHPASLMLLNNEGYWLYSGQESYAWGFQLPHGRRFSNMYADTWAKLRSTPAGQFRNEEGLFTYQDVSTILLPEITDTVILKKVIAPSMDWRLVSQVDNRLLFARVNDRAYTGSMIIILVLIVLVPVSRVWGIRAAKVSYSHDRIRTYSDIIEQSNELVYVVSAAGEIQFANQAVERCYGYSLEELVGKPASIFKSGQHPDEFYSLLWRTVIVGDVFEGVFVNKRKDGSLFYETKRIIPIKLKETGVTVFVSLGQDLTLMIENKHKDILSAKRLSQGIQHHFNNLLTGVMGYLQMAQIHMESSEKTEVGEMLTKSLDSAVRVQELISKVGDISNIDKGECDSLEIADIVDNVADIIKPKLPAGCSFDISICDSLSVIHGNAGLLKSAIKALVENSLDAIGDEGHIQVDVNVMEPINEVCVNCHAPINGNHLSISVRDNGVGISEEHLSHIFDPFFSHKESAHKVAESPGLGLSLVRSIAHVHNGHILLESKEGVGTTVWLLIPLE
ncbi:ATP-binding protein [Pseudomonadota bacterium]